jgi:hypothetical protein
MKEALSSSETSVLTKAIQRNIPEDTILLSHRHENLKSYVDVSRNYIEIYKMLHVVTFVKCKMRGHAEWFSECECERTEMTGIGKILEVRLMVGMIRATLTDEDE